MQLLKWLFAILVILNIIVFANTVTQKMNGNRPTQNSTVVAVPIDTGGAGSGAQAQSNLAQGQGEAARMVAPAAPVVRRDVMPAQGTLPKNAPTCTAQITLPEDAYHRLKNFINGWGNSAVRNVVENKQAAKKPKLQYQVLAAGVSEETVGKLKAAGVQATPQGANLSLGIFANASQAQAVRQKAIAAGVAGVVVNERGTTEATALTSANYTVTFRNVSSQDAARISEVLGRYGRLQRSACPQ